MSKGLTEKQKAYCRSRAKGKDRMKAADEAGYSVSKWTAQDMYHMEVTGPRAEIIQKEIDRLRRQAEKGAILDRKQRQALLTEIVLDTEEKTDNRLRAADMLNRMGGDYTDRMEQVYSGGLALSYEDRKKMLEEGLKEE